MWYTPHLRYALEIVKFYYPSLFPFSTEMKIQTMNPEDIHRYYYYRMPFIKKLDFTERELKVHSVQLKVFTALLN